MQMIPTAMPGTDATAPQSPQSTTTSPTGAGASTIFPELLKQTAAPVPQKTLMPGAPAGSKGGEMAEHGSAAEGTDLLVAIDTLLNDLSQLALEAQGAFQSATSLGAKADVMSGFISEFQTQLAAFQSKSLSVPASLTTMITTELTQSTTLQFGLGTANLAGPMQAFENAMGVLRSALPVAAQAGAAPVSSVSQAAGPVPGADAPAPPVLAASAAGAPTPDTAAVTPNQIGATPVPQASVQGAVPAAAVTAPADPAAPAEPLPQITPASEPRANAQGEELPLAAPREAPKAALANLTFTSEAPKPVGQAPAMVQAITPMAQPSAATDAAAALSPEAPAAVASRASADLAPAFSFARNIAAQVRGTVFEEGKTRVELTPRGLGDIEVEVARDDSGKLRVVLRAENAAVLTAFRNDRDMILGMLRDGGVAVEDGEVAFESFGGHASYEDRGAPRSRDEIESVGASPLVSEEALMPIRPAAAHATSPSGALDITT